MANSYSTATAHEVVPCTKEEFEQFKQLLSEEVIDDKEGIQEHGFETEYHDDDKALFLYAETSAMVDYLPIYALKFLGKLIEKAGKPHLELGIAWTCDKLRVGSHGGIAFRIYPDGETAYPIDSWER